MSLPYFTGGRALPLPDRSYLPYLEAAIDEASERVWAAVFIADVLPRRDVVRKVRGLVEALARAAWRGVEVRLVLGSSRDSLNIDITDQVALAYIGRRGVPVRAYRPPAGARSLHSKLVVIDRGTVVLGSHNWSHEAFTNAVQDSIALVSAEANELFAAQLDRLWQAAGGAP